MFSIPNPEMKAAACKSLSERDRRRFFDGSDNERIKKICDACPVKSACLQQVLEFEHQPGSVRRWGIWGGMTASERYEVFGDLTEMQEMPVEDASEQSVPQALRRINQEQPEGLGVRAAVA